MLVSAFSGVYFISDILKPKTATKIELNILTLVRLTAMLAVSYFDQNVQMNAPDKILFGIACVIAMVFTVSELKLIVGSARKVLYTLSAALTVLLCSTASIPSIIAFHAGRLPENNGLYFEYYFLLAMAIYAAIRLVTLISPKAGDIALYSSAEKDEAELSPVADGAAVDDTADASEPVSDVEEDKEATGGSEPSTKSTADAENDTTGDH